MTTALKRSGEEGQWIMCVCLCVECVRVWSVWSVLDCLRGETGNQGNAKWFKEVILKPNKCVFILNVCFIYSSIESTLSLLLQEQSLMFWLWQEGKQQGAKRHCTFIWRHYVKHKGKKLICIPETFSNQAAHLGVCVYESLKLCKCS